MEYIFADDPAVLIVAQFLHALSKPPLQLTASIILIQQCILFTVYERIVLNIVCSPKFLETAISMRHTLPHHRNWLQMDVYELHRSIGNFFTVFYFTNQFRGCNNIKSLFIVLLFNVTHGNCAMIVNEALSTLNLWMQYVAQTQTGCVFNRRRHNWKQIILIATCIVWKNTTFRQ